MDSPSERISGPSTTQSEVESSAASKTDDHDEEQRQRTPTDTTPAPPMEPPTYRPPGYPDLGSIWTQAPKPLPGPEDHPFFKWIADGAQKSPDVLATVRAMPTPTAPKTTLPIRSSPAVQSVIQPQTVYPFLPGPTVTMEPFTPNQKDRQSFIGPSPSHTTPDLSTSPTEPSPASAHTVTPASSSTTVLPATEEKADEPVDSAANPTTEGDSSAQHQESPPECTSTYMRLMSNVESDNPLAVANGQIWRSGSKRDGWRRHQWSLDVG